MRYSSSRRRRSHLARCLFRDLKRIGVDFDEVLDLLEKEGLTSFAKSLDELIASVTRKLEEARCK